MTGNHIPQNPTIAAEDLKRHILTTYIVTNRDKLLANELDALIEASRMVSVAGQTTVPVGRLNEGRIFALTGEAGAGKTRALLRQFTQRSELTDADGALGHAPFVSCIAPSPCTLRLMGNVIARDLGYPLNRELRENVVWDVIRTLLPLRRVRILHIDESQHMMALANSTERQKVRDTLKGILQLPGWPVFLVLSGTPSFVTLLVEDPQLRRRTRYVHFADLKLPDDFRMIEFALREIITGTAGLLVGKTLDRSFIQKLSHAAERQFGTLVELVQDATLLALSADRKSVEVEHFARIFEPRIGMARSQSNVFSTGNESVLDELTASPAMQGQGGVEKVQRPRDTRNP